MLEQQPVRALPCLEVRRELGACDRAAPVGVDGVKQALGGSALGRRRVEGRWRLGNARARQQGELQLVEAHLLATSRRCGAHNCRGQAELLHRLDVHRIVDVHRAPMRLERLEQSRQILHLVCRSSDLPGLRARGLEHVVPHGGLVPQALQLAARELELVLVRDEDGGRLAQLLGQREPEPHLDTPVHAGGDLALPEAMEVLAPPAHVPAAGLDDDARRGDAPREVRRLAHHDRLHSRPPPCQLLRRRRPLRRVLLRVVVERGDAPEADRAALGEDVGLVAAQNQEDVRVSRLDDDRRLLARRVHRAVAQQRAELRPREALREDGEVQQLLVVAQPREALVRDPVEPHGVDRDEEHVPPLRPAARVGALELDRPQVLVQRHVGQSQRVGGDGDDAEERDVAHDERQPGQTEDRVPKHVRVLAMDRVDHQPHLQRSSRTCSRLGGRGALGSGDGEISATSSS